jgi:hypothetical protein
MIKVGLLVCLLTWALPCGLLWADDAPPPEPPKAAEIESAPPTEHVPPARDDTPPYTLIVGARAWISQGRSAHNIGSPSGHPNVLSELTWRGMNSVITQVEGDLTLKRFVMTGSVGYGAIGNGTLLDQDWNGDNRTQKTSETLSRASNGSVWIVSLTPGFRAFQWRVGDNPIPGGIDVLLGYQFWREQYIAYGAQNLLGPGQLPDVKALTQTNTWQSLRLGSRVTVPVLAWAAIKGSAFYIPVTYYRDEDIHHLRTSGSSALRQDPSFLTTATGGNGVQLEASLVVRIWRALTVEAGYTYWDIRSGSGSVQAYPASGGVVVEPHNVDNTRRQGVFFGANWIF